jgi:subfamily B ATP-binding cassette protein MsbA
MNPIPESSNSISNPSPTPDSNLYLYRRLLGYIVPYLGYFVVSIMGFLLFAAMQVLTADILQFLVDAFGGGKNIGVGVVSGLIERFASLDEPEQVNLYVVIAFVFIAALRGIGFLIGNYSMSVVGRRGIHDLRCAVFEHMLHLPTSYYDKNNSGHLVSRITFNVERVQGAITKALTVTIREGATILGLVAYLFYINWQLTLTFVAVAPLIAIIVGFVSKRFRRISKRLQNSMGDLTHITTETISANRELRIFGGQSYEMGRFTHSSENNTSQALKMAFTSSAFSPIIQTIVACALALLLWLCLKAQAANPMSAGQFVAFIGAAALVAKPLRQLSDVLNIIQQGLAAAQDIFTELDLPLERDTGNVEVDRVKGRLEFKHLYFSYTEATEGGKEIAREDYVLKDVNLTIEPGMTVALVGSSGSGKSTLVSLLARFYEYSKGEILLDGVPLRDYRLANLRSQIALVSQQVTLFNDTISHNIAYGALGAISQQDVIKAAKQANADGFICDFDNGYDTMVGDNAVNLSGGQRQRVAIARALLKDAPILIMDEATSALDNESERLIQSALENIMQGRTTFVIAHRLSTIEKADLILVMEKGEIIESGTHAQLLECGGRYSQLHQNEFIDD